MENEPRRIEIPEVVEFIPRYERVKGFRFRTTAPDRPWMDISYEINRKYTFQTPYGEKSYIFEYPAFLDVSGSGHRLVTQDDKCYWIDPKSGNIIEWKVEKGAPHFVLNSGWRENTIPPVKEDHTRYGNWQCRGCFNYIGINVKKGFTHDNKGPFCASCLKIQNAYGTVGHS